jgi:ribonucrease Y
MGELSVAAVVALAAAFGAAGAWLGRLAARRQAEAFAAGVRRVAEAVAAAAAAERAETLHAAEVAGREESRALVAAFETSSQAREVQLDAVLARVSRREADLARADADLRAARERTAASRARVAAHEAELAQRRDELAALSQEGRAALERRAGETAAAARAAIIEGEVEDARLHAAQLARSIDHTPPDEAGRGAKRVMGIAVGRFSGHYLTERLMSTLALPSGPAGDGLVGRDEGNLRAIEAVAGVKLTLGEGRESLRLEGLDGVGREVARRSVARLLANPRLASSPDDVTRTAREVAAALDRELADLGRRAFAALEIPAAHPEIVNLVGRLNYRTSYTQNQWKHAVEAAFLCGMMAEELALDLKLARRAALMHDIGKALTHELDGSHAVIGADYARRLGESEIVANAIGAHHTDEPFNSPYAYLVAAADAMSGARPGARRQTDENYMSRLDDLERITRGFRGIAEAYAVQGGREVRIYVQEDRVDDLGAVDLSTEVARKISLEMRFPGQIRVTVIREFKAVEVAT